MATKKTAATKQAPKKEDPPKEEDPKQDEAAKADEPKQESKKGDGFVPDSEILRAKMRAGLRKDQALEAMRAQWEHDQTNPHDDEPKEEPAES